jgi:tRNA-binding EMAP/Myf-like protein
MRTLASIQVIKKIEPIEGADRIELATVLGWHVVIQKGLYHEGDLVIYLEIDSVLPKELAERANFTDKYLKTRRFRGVYSQGMCLPISELPAWYKEQHPDLIKEGTDVTTELGITKWESDPRNNEQWWKRQKNTAPKKWYMKYRLGRWFWKKFLYKPVSGPFPTDLVPKTDETRVQVLGDILAKYKGTYCQYTEKLDGSSITLWLDKKEKLHVCSRNREIFDETDFMYKTAAKLKDRLLYGFVYQGEILGPNIQGNKYGLKDYEIRIFNIYSPKEKAYLTPYKVTVICENSGLKQVPVLGHFELTDDIDELVKMAGGISVLDSCSKVTQREGIVIRPIVNIDGLYDSRFVGGRLSFKVINPKFLVKYNI